MIMFSDEFRAWISGELRKSIDGELPTKLQNCLNSLSEQIFLSAEMRASKNELAVVVRKKRETDSNTTKAWMEITLITDP